ncbi:unnamed protein product, partial [Gongylonema pulchrum]|uniref:CCDC50_N domain-containing protein n=1 Tax=Gongylonema pulchrum TaxID=637853 RepID=A0A183EUW5_9BILA
MIKRLVSQNEAAERDIVNSPDRLQSEQNDLAKYLGDIEKQFSIERRACWDFKEKQKARIATARVHEHLAENLNKLHERRAREQQDVAKAERNEITVKVAKEQAKL